MIVCNRFIPESVTDNYFHYWKENQEKYYRTIEERFAPLTVFTVPLMEQEVVGLDMLRAMAQELFRERDPNEFFQRGDALQIEKKDGRYTLSFTLPYTSKEDISLVKSGDELIVHVGTYRRIIALPRALVKMPVKGAKFDDKRLVIKFGDTVRRRK
jgi:arsenite-transporting ATPase